MSGTDVQALGCPGTVTRPDPIKAPGPTVSQSCSVQLAVPLQEQSGLGWTNRKPVRSINVALRSLPAPEWLPAVWVSPAHRAYSFPPLPSGTGRPRPFFITHILSPMQLSRGGRFWNLLHLQIDGEKCPTAKPVVLKMLELIVCEDGHLLVTSCLPSG